MMLPLAKISLLMHVMIVLFIAIALLLILVILIQKGKGGGLGAAFGGMGASSLLGSKTGDFLTWVTIGLVSLFLVLAVLMDKYLKSQISSDLLAPPAQAVPEQTPSQPSAGQSPDAGESTSIQAPDSTSQPSAESQSPPAEEARQAEAPPAEPSAQSAETETSAPGPAEATEEQPAP